VAALTLTLGLFVLFAGRTEHRVQSLASEDGRWCVFRSTLAAIADHWPYGAGLAAFPDVFPAYRDTDCAGVFGVWDHAHDFFLEGLLGLGAVFVVAAAIVYAALGAALVRGARRAAACVSCRWPAWRPSSSSRSTESSISRCRFQPSRLTSPRRSRRLSPSRSVEPTKGPSVVGLRTAPLKPKLAARRQDRGGDGPPRTRRTRAG